MGELDNPSTPPKPAEKDWTRGPLLPNLLLLSWPMVVMEALYMVSQIVDMIWIGRTGPSAIAGAGVANLVLMLIMTIDMALITGVRAMIARCIGAGDVQSARQAAGQAYILAVAWGALVTLAGLFLSDWILGLLGVEPEVASQGTSYLKVMFAGWVSMEVLVMGLYVVQSSGDALNPMKVEIAIRAVHLLLCPFLVLGLWIFPQMGIAGAALSNVISQVLGGIAGLWILFSGRTRLHLTLSDFRFVPGTAWRIIKVGLPAIVMNLQGSIGNLVLTSVIIPFGTLAIAAHSLVSRVEMFIYTPSMGLGSGAGVLVGQNLGARQPERAEKSAWLAAGLVEAFIVASGIAILVWAENIIGFFTADPPLRELGGIFLRIAVAGYLAGCLNGVLQSAIAGAGDTLPNMLIGLAMIWIVQIPLAFLLPRLTGLGVYGIRWALVAGSFAGVTATVIYFRLGKWKAKRV